MNNENSVPIADLFELNKRVSLNLWHMANEHGKPSNLSPHVIYPLNRDRTPRKRDRTPRISEQEARVICCGLLNNLSLYYSVETPTEQRYVQKGKKKEGMAAQTDLTMYGFDGQSFKRVINMEFKAHNCGKRDIGKDIEKLVREGYQGNWFHILANYDAGTFPALFSKFKYAFTEYPKLFSHENFSSKTISIIFCFCVLKKQKQKAYMRRFSYEPGKNPYKEYVINFFDSSTFEEHWQLFSKKVIDSGSGKRRNTIQTTGKIHPNKLKWERVNDSFDLKVINSDEIDVNEFKKLLTTVEVSSANWRKDMRFNQKASEAFREWFRDASMALPGYAYALLSNWFLTSLEFVRESPRGQATLEFWKGLFCAVPQDRLTSPESGENHKILPEKFALWWPKQEKCQEDC